MPVPIIKAPIHISSNEEKMAYRIICMLNDMGYNVDDERRAVSVIERHEIDKSLFEYPYGSFDEFKKHVLAGEFDVDIDAHMMTDARRKELDDAVKASKLWVIH